MFQQTRSEIPNGHEGFLLNGEHQVSKILISNRHQVENGEPSVILSIHVDLPLDLVECIVVR